MRLRLACTLIAAGAGAGAWAQGAEGSQPQRGGTYTPPPAAVDPLYAPQGPDRPGEQPYREPFLQLRLTTEMPLRNGGAGSGTQGSRAASPSVQALLRVRPFEDRGWFAELALYRYLRAARQQPWSPDFTYGFGYDDGQPDRFSFTYANYTGTRFAPDRPLGERRFNFPQGQWTVRYRFELPAALEPLFLVGDGDRALCHIEGNFMPRFTQASGAGLGSDKVSAGLGCRYTTPDGWFAQATAYAWPAGRQQPWDPDYVYGFGWTSPGGLTIQYANYSGNRWPGRSTAPGEGAPGSGSVSLGWATAW